MSSDRKRFWKISLLAMRKSIQNTYSSQTTEYEQQRFVDAWAWTPDGAQYISFSDYRRNEGRRRLQDIIELIDNALARMERSREVSASHIYVDTMRQVARYASWYSMLEKAAVQST